MCLGAFGYWLYQNKTINKPKTSPSPQQSTSPEISFYPGVSPQPTSQPVQSTAPSEWKTYTNSKYSFLFKYPEGWFLDKEEKKLSEIATQVLWLTTHRNIPSYQAADLGEGDDIRLGINYIVNRGG